MVSSGNFKARMWVQPHSHVQVQREESWPIPRWILELVAEHVNDADLSRALAVCGSWNVALTTGPWSDAAWTKRATAMDDDEDQKRHCCPRGKFLAKIYAPQRQWRRESQRLTAVVERERRKYRDECRPYLTTVRQTRKRLSVIAVLAVLLFIKYSDDAVLVFFWPVRFAWHISSIARLPHPPVPISSFFLIFGFSDSFSQFNEFSGN